MLRSLTTIALGVVLTALGLWVGWQLNPTHAADEHDEHAHMEHDHDDDHADDHDHDDDHPDDHDHDHEEEEHAELTEQTLKTLGVVIDHAELTDYVRTVDVRAVLVDRPENRRTVIAPMGGVVRKVGAESGEMVTAEEALVTLLRDPIPPRSSETVMGIVLPERTQLLEGLAELRAARTDLEIAEQENERLDALIAKSTSQMPKLFANRRIELGYERARAARRVANAEAGLRHQGLLDDEIAQAASGGELPPLLQVWRRILRTHGAWGDLEEQVLARLPEDVRTKPWPVVLLADLSMHGLVRPDLLKLVGQGPVVTNRFREVAALLLDGYSIQNVTRIAELGALEPEVVIRAPNGGNTHWDLERRIARIGQDVTAGDPVAELHDPRRLWLRLEPIGSEIAHVRRALAEHRVCHAVPVLAGAAPDLDGIHIRRLAPHGEQGTIAYADIENEVLHQEGRRRSWSLHAGTEFVVRVPLDTLPGRFVLPVDAVVRDGPDRIVYVLEDDHDHPEDENHHDDDDHDDEDHHDEDHHDDDHHHLHFHPVPVHVELDTKDVVVIAADGALLEGQDVVLHGAFALHLALQQGRGDPDAGHGHSHH